eukprot:9420186-Prorocentrum_lima.AAC.1
MGFIRQLQILRHKRRSALAGLRLATLHGVWKALSRPLRIRGALQRCWRDHPPLLAVLSVWKLVAFPAPLRSKIHLLRVESVLADF